MTHSPRARHGLRPLFVAWRVLLALVLAGAFTLARADAQPAAARAQKTIVVSLGQQILWAYKGQEMVLSSPVSSGRAGFDTPPGSYVILSKLPVQTMKGTTRGGYYYVPDVPNVMYFTNRGHVLHGAYWHTNFGPPMSHDWVNLPFDIAARFYQ